MQEQSYHFFWSGPFSNWTPSPFWYMDTKYVNVEQFMMAHKAKLFKDYDALDRIMESESPMTHKREGRRVAGFDARLWNDFKYQIVFIGCLQKFEQNYTLKQKLMETGNKILVEASPDDRVWGIGYDAKNAMANKNDWGQNLLGKVLDEVKVLLI